MNLLSQHSHRNGVRIHFLDSLPDSDPILVPLLICPGLSEVAEEYEDLIEYLSPRRVVVLSFRGRGRSDTPPAGYDLKHHVEDIEAVVQESALDRFGLFGFSRGVSYALGYARSRPDRIEKLIVEDYPSEHKAMPPEWPRDYIENYIVPFGRSGNIRPEAVRRIQKESTQEAIEFAFLKPVLAMRGLLDDSLLSDAGMESYRRQFPSLREVEFRESGHAIRSTEQAKLYETIKAFLEESGPASAL